MTASLMEAQIETEDPHVTGLHSDDEDEPRWNRAARGDLPGHLTSVTHVLDQVHGIRVQPGRKGTCPFCGHKTFSVTKDDRLGKCFHGQCGRRITPGDKSDKAPVHQVLLGFYYACHAELLADTSSDAYRYLVEERQVHPQVVADAMLGVVPAGYDVGPLFTEPLSTLTQEIERRQAAHAGKRGRPAKGEDAQRLIETRQVLLDLQKSLAEDVAGYPGFLAFFFTDAYHRVTYVRFRRPFSSARFSQRGRKPTGVFGLDVFPDVPEQRDQPLLVVEGETNALQVQSLMARMAEARGKPPGALYQRVVAAGSAATVDAVAIAKLSSAPVICFDHDAGRAGERLVMEINRRVSCSVFTTPGVNTDLDGFIRSYPAGPIPTFDALRKLIAGAELRLRPFDAIREEIDMVRQNRTDPPKQEFEVIREVCDRVVTDLCSRGKFYNDGRKGYVFLTAEKKLIPIDLEHQQFWLLANRYGILPSLPLFKHLARALHIEAIEHGTRTSEVYSFSHYDRTTGILYVYNFDDQVYRLAPDADRAELVDNGTDGKLFVHNPAWSKVDGVNLDLPAPTGLFQSLIVDQVNAADEEDGSGLSAADARLLFRIWCFALFFPEAFPTKPMLAVIGEKGSGKSINLRKIGRVLFGPSFNVTALTDRPDDFEVAATSTHFLAIDNADNDVRWLEDRLAVCATGGGFKRRLLFTTNTMVEFPVTAFLGITSRTPRFRRDDISDRLLIINVERFTSFRPEHEILQEVDAKRGEIMSDVLAELHAVVRCLWAQRAVDASTGFRMADYAGFALRMSDAAGWADAVRATLARLGSAQSDFAASGDPIPDLIGLWLERNPANIGREISTGDLCQELTEMATRKGMKWHVGGQPRVFGDRIVKLWPVLSRLFEATKRIGGARYKYVSFATRT